MTGRSEGYLEFQIRHFFGGEVIGYKVTGRSEGYLQFQIRPFFGGELSSRYILLMIPGILRK